MCGITFAASTWLSQSEAEVFGGLLYHSMDRGIDSTGAFGVQEDTKTNKRTILYHKDTLSPADFLDTEQAAQVIFPKERKNTVLIGHNRWATVGDVTKKNAHPFVFPQIVGVHNGTIPAISLKHSPDHETDSEAFIRAVNDDGLDETLERVDKSGGAFTLAYYDKAKHTANLIRNYQRPFAIAMSSGIVYGASEMEMLRWYLDRVSKRTFTFKELEPWVLYTFSADTFSEKPKERAIKRYIASYTVGYNQKWSSTTKPPTSKSGVVDLTMCKVWSPISKSWTFRFPFAAVCKSGLAPWEDTPAGNGEVDWEIGDQIQDFLKKAEQEAKTAETKEEAALRRKQLMEQYKARKAKAQAAVDDDETHGDVPEIPVSLRRGADPKGPATSVASSGVPGDEVDPREDTGEDELFRNKDGRVYTRDELQDALAQPCGYCSSYFTVKAAVNDDLTIRGLVYKTDQGNAYVCEECCVKEERKMEKRSVH